jgi:GH15 family glucan-1,4-alpha-glucosidase
LSGYENSTPVRIGNLAAEQFQLDVYGEMLDAMHLQRVVGLPTSEDSWHVQRNLVEFVAKNWVEPDEGIWEIRGPRRHFTHSKVMAWVALDRGIKAVEKFNLEGDVERWRAVRTQIHDEVCARGYNASRGVFTQYYGTDRLDASLLMLPLVGFLPPHDPRVAGTVLAIRDELTIDGLVHRYHPERSGDVDGLPPGEGAFLPCSFWLVDCLFLLGHRDEARARFERLLGICSPLGLLAEEYACGAGRLLGNYPQAFSHIALINSAQNLTHRVCPAEERSSESGVRPAVVRNAAPAPAG